MLQLTENQALYAEDFEALDREARLASWIYPLRRAALSRFLELGFPTRRDEDWKYTNVAPIAGVPFRPATSNGHGLSLAGLGPVAFPDLPGIRLVFVNGRYAPALSTSGAPAPGVKVGSLAEALRTNAAEVEPYLAREVSFEHQAFTALNTAFLSDGAFVLVAPGAVVEAPIHLLFVAASSGEPGACYPRTLLVAGENSQVAVVESYAGHGDGLTFTNAVTEVVGQAGSGIDHYKIQREGDRAFHVAMMHAQLARGSRFSSHSIAMGGALARSDVNAVLAGEGIECTLNGLYVANGRQLVDNHTAIDHASPHCNSHELYKGILDGQARGVFNGKILVRQDAQKTDAKQTNQALLLSDQATLDTKPQLEIFADDVKCTHGATVGQLDAEAVFYLRSRGIGEAQARSLLTYAFAADVVDRIRLQPIRDQLNEGLFRQRVKEGAP